MKKALRRLTLHNFQSHEHTILDLSSGVNVIVGPSDVGKTAVIRALRWLYYNQPRGTGFIRMGASECWVEAETEDGIIVRRYRQENNRKNGYLLVLPGQEPVIFEKHGNTIPEDIKTALGVEEMVIDQDVNLNLNIAYQLEGAFLLETPGTTRAKAIGRLGDAHIVDAAQREIQRDLRSISQEIEKKNAQLSSEQIMLESYRYLPEWESRLATAGQIISGFEIRENELKQTLQLQDRHENTMRELQSVLPLLERLNEINKAEDTLAALFTAREKTLQWQALLGQYRTKEEQIKASAFVLEITEDLNDAVEAKNRLDELEILLRILEQLMEKRTTAIIRIKQAADVIAATDHLDSVWAGIEKVDLQKDAVYSLLQIQRDYKTKQANLILVNNQLEATEKLGSAEMILDRLGDLRNQGKELSDEYRAYRQRAQTKQQVDQRLKQLTAMPQAENYLHQAITGQEKLQVLISLKQRFQAANETAAGLDEKMHNLTLQYEANTREYLECLQTLGTCPVCHGSIDDGHLLELKQQLEGEWSDE